MTRWLLPPVLFVALGCTGLLSPSDAPAGDTADPDPRLAEDAPADGEEAGDDENADADGDDAGGDGDDGAAAAPDTSDTAEPLGEGEGADEGDGGDPSPEAGEGEPDAPQGRRPRRRRRRGPPGRRGGKRPAKPTPQPDAPPAEEAPEPEPDVEEDDGPKGPPTPKPSGITQLSDTHWQVTQSNFERWKNDPYALGGGISQKGEGWEVRWVRKREAWHLGMKNKDVVLQINGKKLKNKAQLAAAYLTLKNKSEFEVLFERKGKQMTHHYTVK